MISAAPWSKLPHECVCSADPYPRVEFQETAEVCQYLSISFGRLRIVYLVVPWSTIVSRFGAAASSE